MAVSPPTIRMRSINPKLGTYFGIFTSAFIALVVLLLIFERLGLSDAALRMAMLVVPLFLFLALGVVCTTSDVSNFFVAGRRVPSFFNGLVLAVTALGGTGFIVLTGLIFVDGFDALCLVIGWCAGFVAMVVMIAPYLRKAGAYTIPSFLSRRFHSNLLGVVAAAMLAVPLLLLIAAEVRIGAWLASMLLGRSQIAAVMLVVVVAVIPLVAGGMRAMTWSSVAKSIAAIFALIVPVTVLAALVTNLPLPQMSHGPVLRALGRQEAWQAFPIVSAAPLAFDLAGQELASITRRFATPFSSVGPLGFILASLVVMTGIASSSRLLLRVGAAPGVYESRKAIGWAAVVLGIVVMTLSGVAVFMRDFLMDQVVGASRSDLPLWFKDLMTMGFAGLDGTADKLSAASIKFSRDGVLLALPIAAGFPLVVFYLAIAGALAAALAGIASGLFALGASVSEDVILGFKWNPDNDKIRLISARISIVVVALIGGSIAVVAKTDPLDLLLWSLAISGSTAFPVLVLSVWWKRLNHWGAGAGMVAGFAVAVAAIIGSDTIGLGVDGALAGIFGVPVGFIVAAAVTFATPLPRRRVLEAIRDVRVPGGETLYDRDMRLLRLKKQQRD